MDLIPVNVDGVVVFNTTDSCVSTSHECKHCLDIGGALHNWLMVMKVNYILIDFQDEKDVCSTFLVELLQLRKRLNIPFIFTGLTLKPQKFLESYEFLSHRSSRIFSSLDEAIEFLKTVLKDYICGEDVIANVKFGEPISIFKIRQAQKNAQDGDEDEDSQDDDEDEDFDDDDDDDDGF